MKRSIWCVLLLGMGMFVGCEPAKKPPTVPAKVDETKPPVDKAPVDTAPVNKAPAKEMPEDGETEDK